MPPDDPKSRRVSPVGNAPAGATGNAGKWGEGDLGEVYFEFRPVGHYMRVNVIHAATGRETFVLGPLNANRANLQVLGLRKLRTVLNSD